MLLILRYVANIIILLSHPLSLFKNNKIMDYGIYRVKQDILA